MTIESINDFYSIQFQKDSTFKNNYDLLKESERRKMRIGDMDVWIQYNPGRKRSSEAATDKVTIENRACFLCRENRPENQIVLPVLEGWDWLINPYPIFPVHFTIVGQDHEPQGEMPLDIISAADSNPDLAFFYNGAKSGASAPDHLHFQGILKEELPLLSIVECLHEEKHTNYIHSSEMDFTFPMRFISFLIYPDLKGMAIMSLLPKIYGFDTNDSNFDPGMMNCVVWTDRSHRLRCIIFPRKNHRPDLFFRNDNSKRVISPGAIDMCGILITPDKPTFDKITDSEIVSIYNQTGLTEEEYNKWKDTADNILSIEL